MRKIITKNEKETMKLGEKLAKGFRNGRVVAFEGDLGAGKTTLIKGIARGLGINRNITSPTFVLMKFYPVKHSSIQAFKQLCHVDAYRINDASELIDIGVGEYLDDEGTVVVIEWAEKVKEILPDDALWVKMGYGKEESERVVIIND